MIKALSWPAVAEGVEWSSIYQKIVSHRGFVLSWVSVS